MKLFLQNKEKSDQHEWDVWSYEQNLQTTCCAFYTAFRYVAQSF